MRRRDFIALLGGAAIAWPVVVARAQQTTGKVAHIAYLGGLSPATIDPRQIEQLKAGLAENGLIEDQNITVDYRWAEGSTERMQQLAAELARRNLDVIVTAGIRTSILIDGPVPFAFDGIAVIGALAHDHFADHAVGVRFFRFPPLIGGRGLRAYL